MHVFLLLCTTNLFSEGGMLHSMPSDLYINCLLTTFITTGRSCAMSRECTFKFLRNMDYSGQKQMIGLLGN